MARILSAIIQQQEEPLMPLTKKPHDTRWPLAPVASKRYRPWLTDHGSLTRRIEARSPGMQVKVIFQGRRRLHRDEKFLASGGGRGTLALTRDVLLFSRGVPIVYAHSVLRPGDRGAGWRLMKRMGSRPLGAALFTDPRIRRLKLRQRKLGRAHELYGDATRAVKAKAAGATGVTLWARRSLFMVGKSPILVSEVFLPGVLAL
jgi:chorismate--pyruvate lyase